MRCGTTPSLISPETGWTPTENRVSSMLLPHTAFSHHHFPDQMLLLFIVKRMWGGSSAWLCNDSRVIIIIARRISSDTESEDSYHGSYPFFDWQPVKRFRLACSCLLSSKKQQLTLAMWFLRVRLRQISMLFIDNKDSVFCTQYRKRSTTETSSENRPISLAVTSS